MRRKVKVVFLFASNGAASPGSVAEWSPTEDCASYYTEHHSTEGYMKMLGKLRDKRQIDDLLIFYESNRDPGLAEFYPGVYGEVLPEIRFVEKFIDQDTIIFARGGFKGWFPLLSSKKGKNWLMLYAANTGRERWNMWDVVLHDLEQVNKIDEAGRYWHFFNKPVDEETFYAEERLTPLTWDICIGANHIHDKKGQWRTIEALTAYKHKYNQNLRAVLPGSFRRGEKTNDIVRNVNENGLEVTFAGMVPREVMRSIYNSSKYFVHLATGGQNDRGPIEALACGTPIVLADPSCHSPLLTINREVSTVILPESSPEKTADVLHGLVENWNMANRKVVQQFYKFHFDFEHIILPRMSDLLFFMANYPPTLDSKTRIQKYFDRYGRMDSI